MNPRAILLAAGLAVAALAMAAPMPALAVGATETLSDPVLEARARAIGKQLRCLVCQNQSIDDSDADLAKDIRRLVREQLVAGKSDDEIIGYLVSRYGDFILLRPPFKAKTLALWIGPGAFLVLAGAGALVYLRRRARAARDAVPPLTDDERRRLNDLLGSG